MHRTYICNARGVCFLKGSNTTDLRKDVQPKYYNLIMVDFSPYDLHGIVGRLCELYLVWSWIQTVHTGTHL